MYFTRQVPQSHHCFVSPGNYVTSGSMDELLCMALFCQASSFSGHMQCFSSKLFRGGGGEGANWVFEKYGGGGHKLTHIVIVTSN